MKNSVPIFCFSKMIDEYRSYALYWTYLIHNFKCFWIVLEKTLKSPLDCKDIKPVNLKGNQPWIFIGKTAAKEDPILWPPDVKNWLIWKNPDAGKDWRWEEKGTTEDEMDGITNSTDMSSVNSSSWWWTGNLVCCSPWGYKELDMTEQLS